MSAAAALAPRVIRASSGRARIHISGWSGDNPRAVERALVALDGVVSAEANSATGNVLVKFDPAETAERGILERVAAAAAGGADAPEQATPPPRRPPALHESGRRGRRARIAVRGLDRDPDVARRVVERLERRADVRRAVANVLTCRVLVEFAEHEVDIDELLSEIADVELPEAPGEDTPTHPLDPAPLIDSAARTVGAALGLGLLAVRRAVGASGAPLERRGPAEIAGTLGIVEGLPPLSGRVHDVLGPVGSEVVFGGVSLLSLTFSGSGLGLAVAGAGAAGLLREVRARRAAWREYEHRQRDAAPAHPGRRIRLAAGERAPLRARVLEGVGTARGADGLPRRIVPGERIDAGSKLAGGSCLVELENPGRFHMSHREQRSSTPLYDRYLRGVGAASLGYAVLSAVLHRSPRTFLTSLLLVNPRAALAGLENADNLASARVLRSGVTVVGSRHGRAVRRPDTVVIESARVVTDGVEVATTVALTDGPDEEAALRIASAVSAAAGSPWGDAFPPPGRVDADRAAFDGTTASADVDGRRWTLRPAGPRLPARARRTGGDLVLLLRRQGERTARAAIALRPRLGRGAAELVATCEQRGVAVHVANAGGEAAKAVARRASVVAVDDDGLSHVRTLHERGQVVAFLSDAATAAEAFALADLGIALTSGQSGSFPARADLLAPDLAAVAAIVEASARRDETVRDSVVFSSLSNVAGAVWGLRGGPAFSNASRATYVGALGALVDGWIRLRGGRRSRSVAERLADPRPERFGRRSPDAVLKELASRRSGLTAEEAAERRQQRAERQARSPLRAAIVDQIRSPLTAFLGAGAGLSFAMGAMADVVMIGAVIGANALVGAWQERQASEAVEALERMGAQTATVIRDGAQTVVPADQVVPGDLLVLAPGDRVAADARLLEAEGLEVDESALTGESMPVVKAPDNGTDVSRVVLDGSDVTTGTGVAVVVAVGSGTRLGATAAALELDEDAGNPLAWRLDRMMRQGLPLVAAAGALVTVSGLLWGQALVPQIALGASIAIAAVPEGLPLLAGVSEAAVARRLASRQALVRRLGAIEALGRVDVACADKTGTLTEGRLALTRLAGPEQAECSPDAAPASLADVLLVAALASPHPDAPDFRAHPTDVAVVEAARSAGLAARLRAERGAHSAFDPVSSFHATVADGRLCVKGAAEVLVPRCAALRRDGTDVPVDAHGRKALLARADTLAEQGLRVLMVAQGRGAGSPDDPRELVALGFLGISDPIRPTVPAAVRRCAEAGVRTIMLTGDHPATARAVARDAGLPTHDEAILVGSEIGALDDAALAERLDRAHVIARMSPLDKLRIVEALQRRGHVVAMTGDGVNDAPALRLADVGMAIGPHATEVARQAADVVIADENFSTLVETLVEGRSFWRNIRRALGLLLGGNLGEVGLMVGASVAGRGSPLTTRQILAVNLATDVLPAVAVAVQEPEHRSLAGLSREGTAALGGPLRADVLRRGLATALPSLAAYVAVSRAGDPTRARTVAFSSVVTTQLAQALDLGRAHGQLTRTVTGSVGVSVAVLGAAMTVPPLPAFLGLTFPGPLGLALIAAAAGSAVAISRALRFGEARAGELAPAA